MVPHAQNDGRSEWNPADCIAHADAVHMKATQIQMVANMHQEAYPALD
jgi:hypothetical protein